MDITLERRFTATLVKSPAPGGWTYVVMPGSTEFFGTHKLPVKADLRRRIQKEAGQEVEVHLLERFG